MQCSTIGRSVVRVLSPAHRFSLLTSRAASQTSNMSQLLSASPDRFDGIIVDEAQLPDDVDEFKTRLSNSIKVRRVFTVGAVILRLGAQLRHLYDHATPVQVWQQQQKHGVWIKVPMKKVRHDAVCSPANTLLGPPVFIPEARSNVCSAQTALGSWSMPVVPCRRP